MEVDYEDISNAAFMAFMIDQIGGWSTAGVGHSYGEGYTIDRKWEWMQRIK